MAPFIEKSGDLENNDDALGRPLADIEREMVRQRKKVMNMEKEVEETVLKAKDRRSLNRTLFYVGYFNCLCKTDQGFYIPCEGAVVEFSLEKGISRCWQEFLSPWTASPRATSTGAPSTPRCLTTSALSLRGSPLTALRY